MEEKEERQNGKKILILLLLILLIGLLVLLFIRASYSGKEKEPQGSVILDANQDEIPGILNGNKVDGMFTCTGYPSGDYEQDSILYLLNDPDNEALGIHVIYTISAKDGEELFRTGLIEPGKAVAFVPAEYLTAGENTVTIVETPYIYNERTMQWEEKFSGRQDIVLTISD